MASLRVGTWLLAAGAMIALAVGCAGVPGFPAPDATPNATGMDKDPFGPLNWMISPTQGRPALVKVGQELPVQFRLPADFAGRSEFLLVDSLAPDRPDAAVVLKLAGTGSLDVAGPPPTMGRVPAAGSPPADQLASGLLAVPESLPPGLYDLVIRIYNKGGSTPLRVKTTPRAVAVYADFPASFRFVQLSNMNVGGLTSPGFSDELVEEVNRIAPAFIITTGDYTEWSAVRNDPESWRAVKQYFARFDAPVFLTLGDLDHDAGFQQFVAPSRSGQFTFGRCRGFLLHDTYRHPIDADPAQFQWLDSILSAPSDVQFNFLVSPNDSLRVFDAWRRLGYASPREYVQDHRIGLVFVGGYSDWDFSEYAAKAADTPIHYIRTHASSTTIRGKATGVPHYRIVQLDQSGGESTTSASAPEGRASSATHAAGQTRVSLMVPENGPVQRALHSTPVGQVRVSFDHLTPNDGSADRVKVTVLNRLTIPLAGLRVKVKLRPGKSELAAAGGTIERIIDPGKPGPREVWLRIDCPDLGAAVAEVGPAESVAHPRTDLAMQLLGDSALEYRPARTADGFNYFVTNGVLHLQMTNNGSRPIDLWPIVRLNGNVLPLRGGQADQAIRLAPGEQRTLPISTPLALASPGEHWLTVSLPDDPLPFLVRRAVTLVLPNPPAGPATRAD